MVAMVEQGMSEFDEVYNPDDIENAQPIFCETRDSSVMPNSFEVLMDRILKPIASSLKQKSVLGELEEGPLNLEQPMNLYAKVDLHRQWVDLEHHYKSDSVGSLCHPIFVKPLAYCLVDKDLLFVCGFMQKGSLDNQLSKSKNQTNLITQK
ncbi:hypothetical protein Dsin_011612 [Dipteronia sinensis]|uniref:Uncharacterized protein n=1 Tax=Dipteronia sinensis TaxID=43782 RepID=A0AAE0E7P6_9ROSI|nr:hypothetical protein Dsin_011612 [Dipteronia sinensis]